MLRELNETEMEMVSGGRIAPIPIWPIAGPIAAELLRELLSRDVNPQTGPQSGNGNRQVSGVNNDNNNNTTIHYHCNVPGACVFNGPQSTGGGEGPGGGSGGGSGGFGGGGRASRIGGGSGTVTIEDPTDENQD